MGTHQPQKDHNAAHRKGPASRTARQIPPVQSGATAIRSRAASQMQMAPCSAAWTLPTGPAPERSGPCGCLHNGAEPPHRSFFVFPKTTSLLKKLAITNQYAKKRRDYCPINFQPSGSVEAPKLCHILNACSRGISWITISNSPLNMPLAMIWQRERFKGGMSFPSRRSTSI